LINAPIIFWKFETDENSLFCNYRATMKFQQLNFGGRRKFQHLRK